MEVGWGGGLVIAVVVTWVIGAYFYWCVRALPIGVPRLLASIPVLLVYAYLPLIFNRQTHLIGVGAYFCIFTWVGSFKLLLFCWNQGPGCEPWVFASFPRFAIVMSFPAHIKRKGRVVKKIPESSSWFVHITESETWSMLLVRSGVKVILLGYLLNYVFPMRDSIPKNVMLGLYCIQLYLFVTILLETLGAIANSVFGVELEPHFDNPLMATSLEEFWARRWNLLVSNMLRETVYNPVYWLLKTRQQKLMAPVANQTSSEQQSGAFGATNLQSAPGIKSRSSIQEGISEAQQRQQQEVAEKKPESQFDIPKFYAMLAAFFVSGLAHELAVYYMTLKVTGEMTAFFTLQGLATGLEAGLKVYYRHLKPPKLLRRFLTLGFCFITSSYLFWPPMSRGADLQVIAEMQQILRIF
jgi:hypothetical protein